MTSGCPTSRITRSAIDWLLVEIGHPFVVARAIGIARRIVGRPIAGALLHDAQLIEDGDLCAREWSGSVR